MQAGCRALLALAALTDALWMPALAASQPAPASAAAPPPRLNHGSRAITLVVPMRAAAPLGQVQLTIEPDDQLLVLAADFAAALGRVVRPAEIDRIRAAADAQGRLSAAAAARLGYLLRFDPAEVVLVVSFAPALLATRTVVVTSLGEPEPVAPDRSAPLAAFLNYRLGERVAVSGPDRGRAEFLGDLEAAGRIGHAVSFDLLASVVDNANRPFSRVSSRLFYDLPRAAIRITAGDLISETAGFQADPQISGVNISHLVNVFYPGAPLFGTSSRNLVLTRPGSVQIIANGVPVSQIQLNPGSYDLRNLPVAQGANRLQAIITDDTGQRRVQNFTFFQSSLLLNPGLDEYSLSLGVLAPFTVSGPQYTNLPALSGFYRRGISDQLTLGANIQAAGIDQVIGLDGTVGTRFGLVGGNLAVNRLAGSGLGYAARLQYSFTNGSSTDYFARTLDLLVEYDSSSFQPLFAAALNTAIAAAPVPAGGGVVPGLGSGTDIVPGIGATRFVRNPQALLVTGSVTQPILRNLYLQGIGNYFLARGGTGNRGVLSLLVTYQAPSRTTLGVGATYQWSPRLPSVQNALLTSGRGLSFLVTLTRRLGARALVTASADRFNQRASFSRAPEHVVDDWFASADFAHGPLGTTGDAAAGFVSNRGSVQATFATTLDSAGRLAAQQVGLFASGSVAFADGRLGIGRRITDAFAVVSKDRSLGDRQVVIQTRYADEVIARTGTFGPAVVPFSSYQRASIPYDVADLPPGYDLGAGNFDLYAWYHGGFGLKVGSPYNNTVQGDLVDAAGAPAALRVGTARSLDDPHAPPVEIVTNRVGRFSANGLAPGRYRITLSGDEPLVYVVTFTQNPQMLVRVGTLRPSAP